MTNIYTNHCLLNSYTKPNFIVNLMLKHSLFLLNETHDHTSANYYSNDNTVGFELEKLKITVRHLEEIIIQKDREIAAQGEIIALLKGQKEEVVGL